MTTSPFTLPPGPKRRELMLAQGANISDGDFTEAELAVRDAEVEKFAAARDKNVRPIADLFRVNDAGRMTARAAR